MYVTSWSYVTSVMTLRLCDTQWPNSGLFLQNALVEYIGVYSDTNNTHDVSKRSLSERCAVVAKWFYYVFGFFTEEFLHEAQKFTQVTPMEINILFQLVDVRHQTGYVHTFMKVKILSILLWALPEILDL